MAQDLDIPLSLHTGTVRWQPGVNYLEGLATDPLVCTNGDLGVRESLVSMIFSGVFERLPRLRVGAVEFEISSYKERIAGVRG